MSTIVIKYNPVTLIPDTATKSVSIGLTSTLVYEHMANLIIKMQRRWQIDNRV